jgi:acetyltransferase-like isoleucine patch superfamily enzyme
MLRLGERCRLGRGVEFDTATSGVIEIGECVRINSGAMIVSNAHVRIGRDTLIGEYVSIRDGNHGTDAGLSMRSQPQNVAGVVIGSDVWIGRGCCILKGARIGDGAVVGANSVVTGEVLAGTIVAGAPARQIGSRTRSEGA